MKQGTPVILCIGSDKNRRRQRRSDCRRYFGKKQAERKMFRIRRDGKKSVNGRNVQDFLELIKYAHPESPVIAVDACLSKEAEKPFVAVVSGGVNPKKGDNGNRKSRGRRRHSRRGRKTDGRSAEKLLWRYRGIKCKKTSVKNCDCVI
ncbi:MAG: DUF1256 domain-containing protein [Clostridiales bacterium]|nr:MAG: DUF1256 domain-containing protein [Clostridiales bacterium]